ncbi:NAD-dependent epimerase/dehydratase [Hyaloraphidium curvatum]|nr:NAD-dependent epimerase/dehydratase [Hyaloraphidium curvatum]
MAPQPKPAAPGEVAFVTGAAGYIASHLVAILLNAGYTVRGSVRDPAKAKHLTSLPGAAERLQLVKADLLVDGSFDRHMEGVTVCFHTASPVSTSFKDPDELLVPALKGTLNVLEACRKSGTVKVIVQTSSVAAVWQSPSDHGAGPVDEGRWNTKSTRERGTYFLSKVQAEKAVVDFAARNPGIRCASINPAFVLGPRVGGPVSDSGKAVLDMAKGSYPQMDMDMGIVDVRDVALLHVLAAQNPAAAGRYIAFSESWNVRRMIPYLKERYPKARWSRLRLPTPLVKLASYTMEPGIRDFLRFHLGAGPWRLSTARAEKELGMEWRKAGATVVDTVEDLIVRGDLKL